ncbi:CGNR zinc finger domain-containing protein [Xanthobacter autotrophicus]|uniref:CGNR zinc finger domain-containing protein n=1 Tax=Xanthobacter autotrophicus TaxID=280 RepID=UPI0024A709EB|nr:ABATE domain-containing protein [Xanthobacter autotrophicus]
MTTPQDSDFRDGMPFLGSRLWIDFANSAPVALGDFLATPEGWTRWLAAAGLKAGAGGKGAAGANLAEVHTLRAALARLFDALRTGSRPAASDLDLVNQYLAAGATPPRLSWRDGGLLVERQEAGDMDPLAAISTDFADFAAQHESARLRHCANPECSLIFYDTARNGTRRWCSMSACGNRHKVRSHRMRAAKLECS